MSDVIDRMLIEMLETQLQLTAAMMADLEAISDHLLALHPDAATKSEELKARFETSRAQSLARAQEMLARLRRSASEAKLP